MPGPSTESLNDEIRELRDEIKESRQELHKVQIQLIEEMHRVQSVHSGEISRIDVSLAELKTQVTFSTRVAIWGITLLTGSLLSGLLGGAWWASKIDYKVDQLEQRFDRIASKSEKFEASVEARFDKLEASLAKILEQTKPKSSSKLECRSCSWSPRIYCRRARRLGFSPTATTSSATPSSRSSTSRA